MIEKLKKNEDEETKVSTKEKGLFIAGGLITIAVISISYTIGMKHTCTRMDLGFERCFKHDPTLETHFRKVLGELNSKPKKK